MNDKLIDRVFVALFSALLLVSLIGVLSLAVGSAKAQAYRHDCIVAMKDKSATDILAVCK